MEEGNYGERNGVLEMNEFFMFQSTFFFLYLFFVFDFVILCSGSKNSTLKSIGKNHENQKAILHGKPPCRAAVL